MGKRYLMKCNHIDNGLTKSDNGEFVAPCCVICGCSEIKKEINNEYDGLENREAKCSYCDSIVKSRWTLPFFKYEPNKKYDDYYCGCFGWD